MNLESRSHKSAVNITASFANKILTLIIKFIVRTVFIYILGKEYLGINGLFTSIISLLSLADLGFSVALPYSLYKPLADNDKDRIQIIMEFYRKVYLFVGLVVLILGIILVPFLPMIIKDMPNIENIRIIYILFIINSSISYFFTYKRTLIVADQKGYIVTTIESVFSLVLAGLQIILLLVFENYIIYLSSSILITVFKNIYISNKCNTIYPFIKNKSSSKISSNEKKDFSKNIFALFIYKVAMVVEVGVDNIIISSFIGLNSVGLYSNYYLIIDSIKNIFMVAFNSLTATIGNVAASEKGENSYLIYKAMDLLCIFFYGVSAIAIWILINPFIVLWVGEDYLLSSSVVLVLSMNYYVFGSQNTTSTFRNAYGLFWEGRYRPVIMTITNILFSLILVKYMGLAGVFMGTIISRLVSVEIIDPYILHKYGFKLPVKPYYISKIKYGIIIFLIGIFTQWATAFIRVDGLSLWIGKGVIVCVISTTLMIVVYWRTQEFKYITGLVKGIFRKRKLNEKQ